MAISTLEYQTYASWATTPAFPPSVPQLIRCVQAADAEEMTRLAQAVLDEVTALNVVIAAKNPQDTNGDLQLNWGDVDLAGAGDGHTFVLVMTFLPKGVKSTFPPEQTLFGFVTASTAEAIGPLLTAKIQETLIANDTDGTEIPWQAIRGGAKGTRLMAGFGGLIA